MSAEFDHLPSHRERIMGSEMEYDAQQKDHHRLLSILSIDNLKKSDLIDKDTQSSLTEFKYYLHNGARIYQDMGHLEYCTPESLGPIQATAAEFAGIPIVRDAIKPELASTIPLYRRVAKPYLNSETGEAFDDTSGYHENYLVKRRLPEGTELSKSREFRQLVVTFLATRAIWSGAGIIGIDGFRLSQKSSGIATDSMRIQGIGNRTSKGLKPFYSLWSAINSPEDKTATTHFTRFEIRNMDPTQSLWNTQLRFATTSLMLRVFEHQKAIPREFRNLLNHTFSNPAGAFHHISEDLDFNERFLTDNHKRSSAIATQRAFAIAALNLSEQVKLPDAEIRAAHDWYELLDDLKRVDPANHDYSLITDRVDWAARYMSLLRVAKPDELFLNNAKAVLVDRGWDRVDESKYSQIGLRWHQKYGRISGVTPEMIERYTKEVPLGTRATQRAELLRRFGQQTDTQWNKAIQVLSTGQPLTIELNDPYGEEPYELPNAA